MTDFFQTHCVKTWNGLSWLSLFLFSAINPKCHHEYCVSLSLSWCGSISSYRNFKTSSSIIKTKSFVAGFSFLITSHIDRLYRETKHLKQRTRCHLFIYQLEKEERNKASDVSAGDWWYQTHIQNYRNFACVVILFFSVVVILINNCSLYNKMYYYKIREIRDLKSFNGVFITVAVDSMKIESVWVFVRQKVTQKRFLRQTMEDNREIWLFLKQLSSVDKAKIVIVNILT